MTAGQHVRNGLQKIQSTLAFEGWDAHPQFSTNQGLGRIATLGCLLGITWGAHFLLQMLFHWCLYVVVLSSFHLLEFFVTALYNPTVTTSDSFLVNHSIPYTAAALLSWMEFWIRFICFPTAWMRLLVLGLALVIAAQIIRSLAMMTCGESFNHLIQHKKKDNHILVTHGIYNYLRHPSYMGFFYWAVGTQLLLGNLLCAILFSLATWRFFQQRIQYEETSLVQHFPDQYPSYRARTWIGIPLVAYYTNPAVQR